MNKTKKNVEQVRFTVQLPKPVYEELEEKATDECEKVAVIVRRAILKYLRSEKDGRN